MEMSECGMALFVSLYQWQMACRFIQRAQQTEQKLNLGRLMKLLLLLLPEPLGIYVLDP
jgi:hypothetical protein